MRTGAFTLLLGFLLALGTATQAIAQQSSDQEEKPLTFATRGAASERLSAEDQEPRADRELQAAEYPYGTLAMPIQVSSDPLAPQVCLRRNWNRDWEFARCMDYVTGIQSETER